MEEYWQPYYASRYFPVWTVIADRLVTADAARVLDVGCGPGQLASYLSELGIAVTGIDFSPKAIAMARKAAPAASFHVGDVLEARWYGDDYDAIVSTEVLEHVERDLELVGLWPPGTRCLCTVPDFPFDSHVRHFEGSEQVRDRYGELLSDLSIREFKGVGNEERPVLRYFLFDGVRV
jgi:SAM-dependent methyltransferase